MEELKKKRASPFDASAPIVRKGKIIEVTPTEREETELFPLFDERLSRHPWAYRILPRDYIGELLQWPQEYLRKRLPKLTHEPNNYLRLPEMQTSNRYKRFLIYCHPETYFKEQEFWHDLMPNMMAAHIELGIRERPDLKLGNFSQIINAPSMPQDGLRSWTIQIPRDNETSRRGKKLRPHYVTPDWPIFYVGRADDTAFRFYCGIEADKGSEPARSREKRKTIRSMLKRAIEIDERNLALTLYGVPEFYFPMVFHVPARLQTALEELYDLTDGVGHPRIILNTFPVYNSFRTPPAPDGSWFRSTWTRAAGTRAMWNGEYRIDQL